MIERLPVKLIFAAVIAAVCAFSFSFVGPTSAAPSPTINGAPASRGLQILGAPSTVSATPTPGPTTTSAVIVIAATASSASVGSAASTTSAMPTSTSTATATESATPTSTSSATATATLDAKAQNACSVVDGAPRQTPDAAAGLEDIVSKQCEYGKIKVEVSSPHRFGNRIGDVIPVTVIIVTDSTISIDFTSLSQGILKFEERSQFKLALEQPFMVRTASNSNSEKIVHTILLRVQNFLPTPVDFSLDLRYQVKGSAARKVLTSPGLPLSGSLTVDGGKTVLDGDLNDVPVREPWPIMPLRVIALILITSPLSYELWKWYRRSRPGYVPSAIEAAWSILNPIFVASKDGFTIEQVSRIEDVVRSYLATDYAESNSLTRQEILDRMNGDSRSESIGKILQICDQILYARNEGGPVEAMGVVQSMELMRLVKQVIPEER